jgi:hypothetical protein
VKVKVGIFVQILRISRPGIVKEARPIKK